MDNLVLEIGSIVTIKKDDENFEGFQGVVMDTESDKSPVDGPIAVFFNTEIKNFLFFDSQHGRKCTRPTPDNYKDCYRVVCFRPVEVQVVEEFSLNTMANRLYPGGFWGTRWWQFPLVPNSHACQFDYCESELLATEKTLVNIWGSIFEIYACEECHKEKNGMCGDVLDLKDPIPGAPTDEGDKLAS